MIAEIAGGRSVVFLEEPDWNSSSDPRHVVKWSKTASLLAGGQRSKAIKLAEHGCVQYAGHGFFYCFGLDTNSEVVVDGVTYRKVPCEKNYNHDPTPYRLHKLIQSDEWVCTCQWNTKQHLPCAHILALKIEFKRKKFGRGPQ